MTTLELTITANLYNHIEYSEGHLEQEGEGICVEVAKAIKGAHRTKNHSKITLTSLEQAKYFCLDALHNITDWDSVSASTAAYIRRKSTEFWRLAQEVFAEDEVHPDIKPTVVADAKEVVDVFDKIQSMSALLDTYTNFACTAMNAEDDGAEARFEYWEEHMTAAEEKLCLLQTRLKQLKGGK